MNLKALKEPINEVKNLSEIMLNNTDNIELLKALSLKLDLLNSIIKNVIELN